MSQIEAISKEKEKPTSTKGPDQQLKEPNLWCEIPRVESKSQGISVQLEELGFQGEISDKNLIQAPSHQLVEPNSRFAFQ